MYGGIGNDLSGLVEPRHRRWEEGGSPPLSLSLIPERRGRASGAVRQPVRSQGRPPSLQFRSRPPRRGPGEAYPEGPALSRQRRARAHTKTLPPHTPHRTSHTPRGRSSVCGQGALHRADLRPSLRAAGLNAGHSAPTTSNAPPWHRGADDQAQRMTPGKRSRASTIAAGRRAAPNHGGRAAAARNLRHNANRARPSTGKHTPRLGHTVPRARERGWPLAREGSFRDPLHDHAHIIPRPGGRRDCNQSSRAACRSLGRLGRRGGEQGTQL